MAQTYEEKQAYWVAYHAAHRERIVERKRKHYAANRERLLAESKESNAARHDEKIKYDREYLATHKEQVRETKRLYRESHRLERGVYEAVRRAKKAGASIRDRAGIKEIYRKAREQEVLRCYLCDELVPMGERHVDHVVPLSKSGDHRPSNLAVACAECNLRKHDKLPEEIGLLV